MATRQGRRHCSICGDHTINLDILYYGNNIVKLLIREIWSNFQQYWFWFVLRPIEILESIQQLGQGFFILQLA